MPSGKIHSLSTVVAAGITVPLLVVSAGQSWGHAAAFAGGCLANLLVNPDLDVPSGSRAYVIMRRTGGNILGKLWQLFWYPYARWLIPNHRHPLSHLPILGTLIRLVYLLGVPALAWWVIGHFVPLPSLPRLAITLELQWAVMGLIFADTLHTLMDWTIKD